MIKSRKKKKVSRKNKLDRDIDAVFGELSSMDPVEFKKELKKILRAAIAMGL